MAPRTKKTEQPVIQEEPLKEQPVSESIPEQTEPEHREQPARRGRPKKEPLPETDMLPLTLGVVLQQARQSKHMKIPSISKKLRIKEIYLEALEKGDYQVFPALVYGVGFLRSYASFLDLNPDEMIARFHKETSDIKEEPLDMPRSRDAKVLPSPKVTIISLIALFFLYLIWNWFQVMTTDPLQALEKPTPTTTVEVILPTEPAPVTADELPATETAPAQASAQSAPAHTPVVYGLKTPARVSFVATGKTTIEVRDLEADKLLLKKDLEAGDRYNPDSDPKGLALKTTDAGALDVYVDSKKIKTLGKKGQVRTGIQMDASHLLKD